MLFFQGDHVIWIFQEGGMHGKLHAYAISFFFPYAYSMISHATHQIIRRIQSPDKETSFSSTVNITLHVSIYYYIRCI